VVKPNLASHFLFLLSSINPGIAKLELFAARNRGNTPLNVGANKHLTLAGFDLMQKE